VGGESASQMMESLGSLYAEQGMFTDSTKVYHQMMTVSPESPEICVWQQKVVRNTRSSGTKRDQVQEVSRLETAYQRLLRRAAAKKAQQDCLAALRDVSRELALQWHSEAQKTMNPDTYALSKYVYKVYLDNFSGEQDSGAMTYYYGDALSNVGSWQEAAEQYTQVLRLKPRSRYADEAAYAMVLAWRSALKIDDGKAERKGDAKPRNFSESYKKMVGAYDLYIESVTNQPELAGIKYQRALIYYDHNQFDEAAKGFRSVVDEYGMHELAPSAGVLLLEALAAQGKTQEAGDWLERLKRSPQIAKSALFKKGVAQLKGRVSL